jgi:hypothetical protein
MRVIHVLRKPLSEGTVAANTLKHGCGGINISASRIGSDSTRRPTGTKMFGKGTGWNEHNMKDIMGGSDSGRWPANVILQHLDGCRCEGVKKVKASAAASGPSLTGKSTSNSRGVFNGVGSTPFYSGEDGKETVANWICEPGCPVRALDEQSGTLTSSGTRNRDSMFNRGNGAPLTGFGDKGGASRFFKQVGGKTDG